MARMVRIYYRQGSELKSRDMGVPEGRNEREYVRDLNQSFYAHRGMWVDTVLVPYHQIASYHLEDGKADVIFDAV